MEKPASVDYPIELLLQNRWSPRAFSPRPVEREKLQRLFEAGRWAPSCFNEQPWRCVLVTSQHPERLRAARSVLVDFNQRWTENVPVLVCVMAALHWAKDGTPNRWAHYDAGQATAHLLVQAEALGLRCHQMGGFDVDRAREVYRIPPGHDPIAMMAIGYPASPDDLPTDRLRAREREARSRKPMREIVFEGSFGTPWAGAPSGRAASSLV